MQLTLKPNSAGSHQQMRQSSSSSSSSPTLESTTVARSIALGRADEAFPVPRQTQQSVSALGATASFLADSAPSSPSASVELELSAVSCRRLCCKRCRPTGTTYVERVSNPGLRTLPPASPSSLKNEKSLSSGLESDVLPASSRVPPRIFYFRMRRSLFSLFDALFSRHSSASIFASCPADSPYTFFTAIHLFPVPSHMKQPSSSKGTFAA